MKYTAVPLSLVDSARTFALLSMKDPSGLAALVVHTNCKARSNFLLPRIAYVKVSRARRERERVNITVSK